jgi:hypothetical protein
MQTAKNINPNAHRSEVLALGKAWIARGFAVIPVRIFERDGQWDKRPVARAFHTVDSAMSSEQRNAEVERWRKEKNRTDGTPLMIGATRTTATLSKVLSRVKVKDSERLGIGLPAGPNGLTVIDLDRHHEGQDGVAVFAQEAAAAGMDWRTLPHCETAGGGLHIYVKGDPARGNSEGSWAGKGINVRGVGGYVVAPDSVRPDGAAWRMADGSPELRLDSLPEMPAFITEKLGRAVVRAPGSDLVPDDADHPQLQRQAIDYLMSHAPSAVKGHRDSTVVKIIGPHLRDLGITEPTALDLIARFWNSEALEKCVPMLSPEELERDVRNAYAFAKGVMGSATGIEFGAVEDEIESEAVTDPQAAALALCAQSAEALHGFESAMSNGTQADIDAAIDAVLDPLGHISSAIAPNMTTRALKLRADLLDAVANVTLGDDREAFKSIGRASGLLDLLKANVQAHKGKANKKDQKVRPTETIEEAVAKALTNMNAPLIDGLLDTGTLSVLYGESNSGKTFVVLDMVASIAMGAQFNGRDTTKGLIYYTAAEGGNGVRVRMKALTHKYGNALLAAGFVLDSNPVDLRSSDTDADAVIANVRAHEARTGLKCEIVVVDTLSRALAGGEENGSTDMGAFVAKVDKIRSELKTHVLVIHHTGKDRAKGARGHSLLRAATDTEIEIVDGMVKITKQRDMAMKAPFPFQLAPVTLGQNNLGRTVTSCVVTYERAQRQPLSDVEQLVFDATVAAAQRASAAQKVSVTAVQVDASAVAAELPADVQEAKGEKAQKLVTDKWRLIEKKPGWLQRHSGGRGGASRMSIVGDEQTVFQAVDDDEDAPVDRPDTVN